MLTHLRRELMHAIWDLLLDNKFKDAYNNGILITLLNGLRWLMFPRMYTYSADYVEK